jgi:hypothetical protein
MTTHVIVGTRSSTYLPASPPSSDVITVAQAAAPAVRSTRCSALLRREYAAQHEGATPHCEPVRGRHPGEQITDVAHATAHPAHAYASNPTHNEVNGAGDPFALRSGP